MAIYTPACLAAAKTTLDFIHVVHALPLLLVEADEQKKQNLKEDGLYSPGYR